MLNQIEYYHRAQESCPQGSGSWYHFHALAAMHIRKWRESNTLTAVKR